MLARIIKQIFNRHNNLSIIIEVFGVVAIWRGVWGILDYYLFPNNPIMSYLVSIVLGLILILIDEGKFNLKDLS